MPRRAQPRNAVKPVFPKVGRRAAAAGLEIWAIDLELGMVARFLDRRMYTIRFGYQ